MSRERTFELLSEAEDRALTADEQQELELLCQASADSRDVRDKFRAMSELLNSAERLVPPSDMLDRIVADARLPRQKLAAQADKGWLRATFLPSALRYAVAAIVGALMMTVLYETESGMSQTPDITELVGTISPEQPTITGEVLGSIAVNTDGISSTARLERRGGAYVLDIRMDAARQLNISVDLTGTGLAFEALAQPPSGLRAFHFENDVLRFEGAGRQRFAVLLRDDHTRRANSELDLRFSSEGNLLKQGAFALGH